MKITRRSFIVGGLSSAFIASSALGLKKIFDPKNSFFTDKISGKILGASSSIGHKLRFGNFPQPTTFIKQDLVIIGGGISGLAAGYQLSKANFNNFTLLDLEKETGGNSLSGKNDITPYPWGAHYVPLLTEESVAVKKLFEDLGIITGYKAGLPIYNEFYICADPDERLFMHGRWWNGLVPHLGINIDEEKQYQRFFSLMESYKNQKGNDGKKVFTIPVDKSSQDKKWIALDQLTMEEWMQQKGFVSKNLAWYVNYCCRDDFGTTLKETSAWAGIHYFAARSGIAANTNSDNVITWPEGNGWLAKKLAEPIKKNIVTNAMAYKIHKKDDGVDVDYFDIEKNQSIRISAKAVMLATPRFISSRLTNSVSADNFSYTPWAIANITLNKLPEGKGADLSWDNVVFKSELLGYVVATHQIPQMNPTKTVITYYWPLTHLSPAEARKEASDRSYEDWQKIFLTELLHIHPELKGFVEHLDIWIWGHAMVRPIKGFIWGKDRKASLKQHPPIFFANSDMSGISIFEEAYTRAVDVAQQMLSFINNQEKVQ
jgi:predicted NAD/FAD-binding protein